MNNKIDYDNLKYAVESSGDEYSFNKIKDPMIFLDDIKKGKISLEKAKEQQKDYYNYLNKIRRGNKSAGQKKLWQMLIFFSIQEKAQLNLSKIMAQ